MRRRVTFSRNLTLSLSRTCRCYCKYCAFATHQAHLYDPEQVIEILDGAARRHVKELLVLTGERPEVNPEVRERLHALGHEDFTAYVVWTCERALERGLLPHTNLGVLSREDLGRLREVTASQGLMLESVSERLMEGVHAGSPTKHPARRLETIRAAGELRIPFTSGILVGIGETEQERVDSLRALAEVHAEHGHIQEVILQNFVPHQRYYGQEPAQIADAAARAYWRTGLHEQAEGRPSLPLPEWALAGAGPVTIEDMKGLISCARELMPDVGIQVPPNLADWWPELVAAGATDLGGLSANGDHISPEHPFPSPHRVRRVLQADGHALSERLCVYPRYINPDWLAQGVLDTIKTRYWSFIPRRGSGRTDPPAPIRPSLVHGAIDAGGRARHVRRQPQHQHLEHLHRRLRLLRLRPGAPLAGRLRTRAGGLHRPDRRGRGLRGHRAVHPVGHPSRLDPRGLPRLAAPGEGDRPPGAPARVQPDGDRPHVRHLRPSAGGGVRGPARGRAGL